MVATTAERKEKLKSWEENGYDTLSGVFCVNWGSCLCQQDLKFYRSDSAILFP